jgi:hypothetical protein
VRLERAARLRRALAAAEAAEAERALALERGREQVEPLSALIEAAAEGAGQGAARMRGSAEAAQSVLGAFAGAARDLAGASCTAAAAAAAVAVLSRAAEAGAGSGSAGTRGGQQQRRARAAQEAAAASAAASASASAQRAQHTSFIECELLCAPIARLRSITAAAAGSAYAAAATRGRLSTVRVELQRALPELQRASGEQRLRVEALRASGLQDRAWAAASPEEREQEFWQRAGARSAGLVAEQGVAVQEEARAALGAGAGAGAGAGSGSRASIEAALKRAASRATRAVGVRVRVVQ